MMTNNEIKMINRIENIIKYLLEEKGFTYFDITVTLDDFIYENDFSNDCNQELWNIQDKYSKLYRGELKC